MADALYSVVRATGDGVKTVWDFSFTGGYIDAADVKARVTDLGGVVSAVDLTIQNTSQAVIVPAVPAGHLLEIYRDTTKASALVQFDAGSLLDEANLDRNTEQMLFGVQEAVDGASVASERAASAVSRANDVLLGATTAETGAQAARAAAETAWAEAAASVASISSLVEGTPDIFVRQMSDITARSGNFVEQFLVGNNDLSDAIDAALDSAYRIDPTSRHSYAVNFPAGDGTLSRPIQRRLTLGQWTTGSTLVPFVLLGAGPKYNGTILRRGWGVNDFPDMAMIHMGPSVADLSANSTAGYGVGNYSAPAYVRGLMLRGGSGTDRVFGHGVLLAQTNQSYIADVEAFGFNGSGFLVDNAFDSHFDRCLAIECGRVAGDMTDYATINDRTKLLYAPFQVGSSRQGGNSNFITFYKPHMEKNWSPVAFAVLSRSQAVIVRDPHYEPGYGNLSIVTNAPSTLSARAPGGAFFATGLGQVIAGDATSYNNTISWGGGGDLVVEGGRGYSQGESSVSQGVPYLLDIGPYGNVKLLNCEGVGVTAHGLSVPKSLFIDEKCIVGDVSILGSWGSGQTDSNTKVTVHGSVNTLDLSYCSHIDITGLEVRSTSAQALHLRANTPTTVVTVAADNVKVLHGGAVVDGTFTCVRPAYGWYVAGDLTNASAWRVCPAYVGGAFSAPNGGSAGRIDDTTARRLYSPGIRLAGNVNALSILDLGVMSASAANPAPSSGYAPLIGTFLDGTTNGANYSLSFRSYDSTGAVSSRALNLYQSGGVGVGTTVSDPGQGNMLVSGKLNAGLLRTGIYTLTTLPSASAYYGYEIVVSNATGGPAKCWSNGSAWINFTTKAAVA